MQVFLLSLISFGNMALASHFAEDHGGSSYEEKTKTVEIPIIKKYGKLIFPKILIKIFQVCYIIVLHLFIFRTENKRANIFYLLRLIHSIVV